MIVLGIFFVLRTGYSTDFIRMGQFQYQQYDYSHLPNREGTILYVIGSRYKPYIIRWTGHAMYVGYQIELFPKDIEVVRASIQKYFKLNRMAMNSGSNIQQKITDFQPSLCYFMTLSRKVFQFAYCNRMTATFFSQSERRHQYVWSFPTFTLKENENIKKDPKPIYFNFKQVQRLEWLLSETYLREKIEQSGY